MSKQIQDAYIVAATRLPVGKRNGAYITTRPDDMLAAALNGALAQVPALDTARIEDVIAGCAMPEAEQGMNVARIGLLLAGLPQSVAGVTVNRFCASGLQAVADAAARIRTGEADIMIGAGTESMSAMPQIMGNKVSMNPAIFAHEENIGMAFGMGLTGEKVAERWKVSREDQDAFALASHQKACAAIAAGHFRAEITPYETVSRQPGDASGTVRVARRLVEVVDGRRGRVVPRRLGLGGEGERLGLGGLDLVALEAAGDLLVEHAAERRDDEQAEEHRRGDDTQLEGLPPPSAKVGERVADGAQA